MTTDPAPRLPTRLTRLPALLALLALLTVATLGFARPSAAGIGGAAPAGGAWPLDPRPEVVSPFDPPAATWGSGHRGVDLRGRVGQPVRAALGGTVTYAELLAGRGVVVVDHGDRRTTYEPVDPEVAVGDLVAPGGRIGTLAATPGHCAPLYCLHWGLILTTPGGDEYADPLTLVGGGPVRLVPWEGLPGASTFGASAAPERPVVSLGSGPWVGLAVGLP